jgi:hypothetical protein
MKFKTYPATRRSVRELPRHQESLQRWQAVEDEQAAFLNPLVLPLITKPFRGAVPCVDLAKEHTLHLEA